MSRPMPIPFPHIPLDEVGGERLTADQLTTITWELDVSQFSDEIKLSMLVGGSQEFLEKCLRAYGHLGLGEKNCLALWARLEADLCERYSDARALVRKVQVSA